MVGWSGSGVGVGCEVSCGVHGVWCVFVWYQCGMCAVNLSCLCMRRIGVLCL